MFVSKASRWGSPDASVFWIWINIGAFFAVFWKESDVLYLPTTLQFTCKNICRHKNDINQLNNFSIINIYSLVLFFVHLLSNQLSYNVWFCLKLLLPTWIYLFLKIKDELQDNMSPSLSLSPAHFKNFRDATNHNLSQCVPKMGSLNDLQESN